MLSPESRLGVLDYLNERYGFSHDFWDDYLWLSRSDSQAFWVLGKNAKPSRLSGLETAGVLAFRAPLPKGYPTNSFMRAFGAHASRNVYKIADETELVRFLRGESIDSGEPPTEQGYCPVLFQGLAVGRGEWKNGVLKCMLPKSLRMQVIEKKNE